MINKNMALPNMVIPLKALFSRTGDGIDTGSLSRVRSQLAANLNTHVSLCIQSPTAWKSPARGNLVKQYM